LLDWLRTDVCHKRPDGSEILYFKKIDYQVFDLFILERTGAANDYSDIELELITTCFKSPSPSYVENLKNNILLALPGTTENFTLEHIKEKIQEYAKVSPSQMKSNLSYFLNRICPIADELNIKLAIHPDDPPYSVFGLSRIVSTQDDCRHLLNSAPYKSNGLCFCTGSFGAREDNNINSMIDEFAHKVHFLHLRNTRLEGNGDFYEANHLEGDTDMFYLFSKIAEVMSETGFRIPMRPDHGAKMLDDLRNNKKSYPGYSGIGRLKGLAELRGLEYAVLKAKGE
jgi:mannonate dehydratase